MKENAYSHRYEIPRDKGVYSKIAETSQFNKIYGKIGDSILVMGSSENLLLIERQENKEIIKIHSKEPEAMKLKLENITGINFSQYRTHLNNLNVTR